VIPILGLVLFMFVFFPQCKKAETPGTQFIIQVDSIIHQDTITAGDALEIKYYGLIGKTKCFSFYKFEVGFDADKINTTAIGLNSESEDCTDAEIYLNGESVKIYELPAGDFTIVVNQQRGNTLESKVHVLP